MKTKLEENVFPDVLRIEASGSCNFKCIHCPTGTIGNSRSVLTEKHFDEILDQISKRTTPRVVVLYHGGEPLINKNLSGFIKKLKAIGVKKTVITTNGSLLDRERSKELIMSGLDELKISFDGKTAEENDSIRKNGNFIKDAVNLKTLCELRKEIGRNNPRIIVSNVQICSDSTLQSLNHDEEFVHLNIPHYISQYFDNTCIDEYRSVPAMVWPGYISTGDYQILDLPKLKPTYCGPLFETITIMANGDVVPCCFDLQGETIFGNVFTSNIFDIWESQTYTQFRKDFKEQRYSEMCVKCLYISPRYIYKQ